MNEHFLERAWYSNRGLPRLISTALLPVAAGFAAVQEAREFCYRRRWFPTHRVEGVKVISFGNLVVGGAGKTPAVIWAAQDAARRGLRVAVVSRGYGRTENGVVTCTADQLLPWSVCGDEPRLIAQRCPGVAVLVGNDRVALVHQARAQFRAQLVLVDDGFSHRRLYRDTDIVVVDGAQPFGNRRLLPAGPLREPLRALQRASLIWWRGVPHPEWELAETPSVVADYSPEVLIAPNGEPASLDAVRGRRWVALVGTARPSRFLRTLEQLGANVAGAYSVGDHQAWSSQLLQRATKHADETGAQLVTTEKDWQRLEGLVACYRLRIGVKILSGEAHLRELLS